MTYISLKSSKFVEAVITSKSSTIWKKKHACDIKNVIFNVHQYHGYFKVSWKCHVSGAFCILNYMYIHVYYIWGYLSLWMLSVYLSLLVILKIHFHCSYDFITFVMSVVLCLHGLLQLNNLLKFLLFERHSIHFQQINYKIYLKLFDMFCLNC